MQNKQRKIKISSSVIIMIVVLEGVIDAVILISIIDVTIIFTTKKGLKSKSS